MASAAIILLADTDTHEATGRTANTLTTAHELADAGDRLQVVLVVFGVSPSSQAIKASKIPRAIQWHWLGRTAGPHRSRWDRRHAGRGVAA